MAEQKNENELPEIIKKLAINKQALNNAIERRTTAFGEVAKKKMSLANAQNKLNKAEKHFRKEDEIVKTLEFQQNVLEQAKQQCLDQDLQRGCFSSLHIQLQTVFI
jgi:DNA repair exonuclease SbcCD ATPase subunit